MGERTNRYPDADAGRLRRTSGFTGCNRSRLDQIPRPAGAVFRLGLAILQVVPNSGENRLGELVLVLGIAQFLFLARI